MAFDSQLLRVPKCVLRDNVSHFPDLQTYARFSPYSPKGKETHRKTVFWKWKACSGTLSEIRSFPPLTWIEWDCSIVTDMRNCCCLSYPPFVCVCFLKFYLSWNYLFSERSKHSCRWRWGRGGRHWIWRWFWRYNFLGQNYLFTYIRFNLPVNPHLQTW